jgi:hypothetical protein
MYMVGTNINKMPTFLGEYSSPPPIVLSSQNLLAAAGKGLLVATSREGCHLQYLSPPLHIFDPASFAILGERLAVLPSS